MKTFIMKVHKKKASKDIHENIYYEGTQEGRVKISMKTFIMKVHKKVDEKQVSKDIHENIYYEGTQEEGE